ncbi:hypothetical protein BHM03_00017822 [Ensete ventricosum]|nr:hypothetical protein BHM03_00017822 [Ensete ventricosum]
MNFGTGFRKLRLSLIRLLVGLLKHFDEKAGTTAYVPCLIQKKLLTPMNKGLRSFSSDLASGKKGRKKGGQASLCWLVISALFQKECSGIYYEVVTSDVFWAECCSYISFVYKSKACKRIVKWHGSGASRQASRVTTSRATGLSARRYTLSVVIRQARLAACRRESVAALAAQLGELLGGLPDVREARVASKMGR